LINSLTSGSGSTGGGVSDCRNVFGMKLAAWPWRDVLQSFEAARDEWSAMEAVVHLELLLEAEGLLIEERTAHASSPGQDRFRAA
jgi:hypothetical protein